MTTIQLNAVIKDQLKLIENDEGKLQKVLNYINQIIKPKEDPTLITEEEFKRLVDEAHECYEKGDYKVLRGREEIIAFMKEIKEEVENV